MMNTTKNNKNQKAFNYAMYMMLGSYFDKMTDASVFAVRTMYLYYVEQKAEKQYLLEDIVIRYAENVLLHTLPKDVWKESVKISFLEEGADEIVVFAGDNYTLYVVSNYRGKNTKLRYYLREHVGSLIRG